MAETPPVATPAPQAPQVHVVTTEGGKRTGPFGWGFGVVLGCAAAVIGIPLAIIFGMGLCVTSMTDMDQVIVSRDEKARDALDEAAAAQGTYRQRNGAYAGELSAIGFAPVDSVTVIVLDASETRFTMNAKHEMSEKVWCISSESGTVVEGAEC